MLAVRPTLRWTAGPKGTRTYNVQVFRVVDGAKLRKVLSAFPHKQRFVVPRKKALARGACYVWRVWPFRGVQPAAGAGGREPLLRAPDLTSPIRGGRTGRMGRSPGRARDGPAANRIAGPT